MRSATASIKQLPAQPSPLLPVGNPDNGLWMKFLGRNIYSTCCCTCFRRSDAGAEPKNFNIHRVSHRLCTRYAPYCTGYPQRVRQAGFAAGAGAVSVAGYLFSAVKTGRARTGFQPCACPPAPLCGKAVESGDNSCGAGHPGPPALDCQGLRVDLDRWRSRSSGAANRMDRRAARPGINGGRQLCQSRIWTLSRQPVDRTPAGNRPRTSRPNSQSWAA